MDSVQIPKPYTTPHSPFPIPPVPISPFRPQNAPLPLQISPSHSPYQQFSHQIPPQTTLLHFNAKPISSLFNKFSDLHQLPGEQPGSNIIQYSFNIILRRLLILDITNGRTMEYWYSILGNGYNIIHSLRSLMVWHFDFCAGFLTTDASFNTNRYLIYGLLATHVIIFAIVKIVAGCAFKGRAVISDDEYQPNNNCQTTTEKIKVYDKNRDQSDQASQNNQERIGSNDSTFNNSSPPGSRELVTRRRTGKGRCLKFFESIDLDQLERLFSIYFGHHAVCVGVCLMYCPYFPVTIVCLIYLFLGLLLFFFIHSKYKKPVPWFWGIACFLNLGLFFGSATFVGLANFDTETSQCYGEIIQL